MNPSNLPINNTSGMPPQYNSANESASQRGQAASEPDTVGHSRPITEVAILDKIALIPSTDTATIKDPPVGSEQSAPSPGSTSGSADIIPTPADSNSISLSEVVSATSSNAGAATGPELTRASMALHNIMTKEIDTVQERITLLYAFQRSQGTIASSGVFPEAPATTYFSDTNTIDDTPAPASDYAFEVAGTGGWTENYPLYFQRPAPYETYSRRLDLPPQ